MFEQVVEVFPPSDAAHGEVTCDHAGPGGPYPILPERTRDRPPSGWSITGLSGVSATPMSRPP